MNKIQSKPVEMLELGRIPIQSGQKLRVRESYMLEFGQTGSDGEHAADGVFAIYSPERGTCEMLWEGAGRNCGDANFLHHRALVAHAGALCGAAAAATYPGGGGYALGAVPSIPTDTECTMGPLYSQHVSS